MSRMLARFSDARLGLLPAGALALVLLLGFAVRALATLAPDCIAGDDGAYYFVQVRGILRGEGLPVPDFPLLFYVLAVIARVLSMVMDQREAIVAAVRWTDTLLPLLLALPVYLFVRDSSSERRAAAAVLGVGLLAVASGNALVMAGGMIKNGAALPFSLLFIYFLDRSLREKALRPTLLAALFFLISSLTHISALALNMAFSVVLVVARHTRRTSWWSLGLFAAIGLTIGLVSLLDPDRGARLVATILRPGTAFSADASKAWEQWPVWLGNALGILGLGVLWRQRKRMEPHPRTLLWAATLTTLAFSFPFLRPDLLERLALVAFVTGLVPAIHLACREPIGPLLLAPVVAFSILHALLAVKTLRVTGLTGPALADLERLKGALPPGKKIVMVRGSLDWWAVWVLDTHFSNWASRTLADGDAYDAVLLLEEIHPGAFDRAPSRLASVPGATLKDGDLLRSESFSTLREGDFFRLSRLTTRREGRTRR